MHINCNGKKIKFYSVLTVIDALLTKAFHTTYTPVPARTKTPNRFILHYLVISSQPVKHRPPNYAMHINCIGEKLNFYSVLTVIDALLAKAFHTTYTPVPSCTKTPNRFILHYLVISSQPIKHRSPCHAYKKYWEIVKVLERIDGHRRVIDQSLSHHICTNTTAYQTSVGHQMIQERCVESERLSRVTESSSCNG